MKEFVCNEVAGFTDFKTAKSVLLDIYFSEFYLLFRTIYFKVRIFMAAYAIYFFNLVSKQ